MLATPTQHGEITLGDSHEYTNTVNPFDREDIRRAMLDYFGTFARLPRPELSEQWHGVYLKHPNRTELLQEPESGVAIVNGLGGAGKFEPATSAHDPAETLARWIQRLLGR